MHMKHDTLAYPIPNFGVSGKSFMNVFFLLKVITREQRWLQA